jgi:hypothetical protein
MVDGVGGGKDFGFVNVVYAESFENLLAFESMDKFGMWRE